MLHFVYNYKPWMLIEGRKDKNFIIKINNKLLLIHTELGQTVMTFSERVSVNSRHEKLVICFLGEKNPEQF